MDLKLRRIILFTSDMDTMTGFYRDVLGLKVTGREKGWVDFDAGPCRIAIHAGASAPGQRPPKLSFYTPDVAAARAALVKRGAKFGKLVSTPEFDMCNGRDPDGNPIALSARK